MTSSTRQAFTRVALLTSSVLLSTAITQGVNAQRGDSNAPSAETNLYMGAPVTLVEAPNGAIANKRILDVADKLGWLKPTVELVCAS